MSFDSRSLRSILGTSIAPSIAPSITRAGAVAFALATTLALQGCGTGSGGDASPGKPVVSWDEFRSSAARNVDGKQIYVVEWDLAVSETELRRRYDDYVSRIQAGDDGVAQTEQSSIVDQVNGVDDIWRNDQQMNLTYCVSNTFGTSKARVVSEMAQAVAAWHQVVRAKFTYLPAQDANCTGTNTSVAFAVKPWTSGGACSFFPSGSGCVARSLVINLADLDTNYRTLAPNMRTVGVFRHELGHILGLRHEHTRPNSGTCFEDNSWRALTAYDRGSVMHYPWCNGVTASDLSLTAQDIAGIVSLYTAPRTLHVRPAPADYDGDGKADLSVVDDNGVWYVSYARSNFARWDVIRSGYGGTNCIPVPADYDGDKKADYSMKCVDPVTGIGWWYVDYAASPQDGWNVQRSGYGGAECIPTPGDYNGDGKADYSVKRVDPASGIGTWFVDYTSTPLDGWDVQRSGYGNATCHPVPADYNGDGKTDYAVKCDSGDWFVDYTSTPLDGWDVLRSGYGDGSGVPVPADYDGDKKAEFSVKGADGVWRIDSSMSPLDGWNAQLPGYGGPGVTPVPADYNGDQLADLSILDSLTATSNTAPTWFIDFAPTLGTWNLIVPVPAFPSL
jgi:hypothetical protein